MFIAIDGFGNRIDADDAKRGQQYFCPICHSLLIVRDGNINAKHYAHKSLNSCSDKWNYDMSEWHRRMQNYFNIEDREVVLRDGQKSHRADVMVNDIVIEFQHSPISLGEFMDRNTFFHKMGKRIAWVFDVSGQFNNQSLYFANYDDRPLLIWKRPLRIFSAAPPISDDSSDFAVWLYWDSEDGDELHKVIWTITDEEGHPNLKRMLISNYYIRLDQSEEWNVKHFFYSKRDYLRDAIVELKRKHKFNIKYIGEPRKPREAYICPRRPNEFGVQLYREKGCNYCRYCYMIAKKTELNRDKCAIYCCYPNQVRELSDGHAGFECSGTEIYEI